MKGAKGMNISVERCCSELAEMDNVYILCHRNPDGDTLGCGFALYNVLKSMGKTAKVLCSDGLPAMYGFLYEGYEEADFAPSSIVAVDVADEALLGDGLSGYRGKVDLCIDHHGTNKEYAKMLCLDPSAAAAAEIMEKIVYGLGVPMTCQIADCIYTGVSTDTGCFRYSNTTKQSHDCAGRMIEAGCDYAKINRLMFEVKSQGRLALEKDVLEGIEYRFGGRCAIIYMTNEMLSETGVSDSELEGVASMPREIEGVDIGITLRQRDDGYKISLRTDDSIDASEICGILGGGGHRCAAGCFVQGSLEDGKRAIIKAVSDFTGMTED